MRIHHYYTQEESYRALVLLSGTHYFRAWVKGSKQSMNTNQVAKPVEKQK
jgi:hypothetical protein